MLKSRIGYLPLLCMLWLFACTGENEDGSTVSTYNLSVSLNENPANGQSLGTISGNTSMGEVSFTLASQSADGAIAVISTTGELIVADSAQFDFETNPTLTAVIEVSNGMVSPTSEITITLSDVFEADWTEEKTTADFGMRYDHKVVSTDSLLMIGGNNGTSRNNEVWSSTNGTDWTQVTTTGALFPTLSGHEALLFSDTVWVLGGESDAGLSAEIWYTLNGTEWAQQNTQGIFSARTNHAAVELNDTIWVVGGNDGTVRNDVWKSGDGQNWIEVSTSGNVFEGREQHSLTTFGGKLVVIGGRNQSGDALNDIWTSTDGITWKEVTANGNLFSARSGHGVIANGGRLWLTGGIDGAGNYLNDTWLAANDSTWVKQVIDTTFSERAQMALYVQDGLVLLSGGTSDTGVKTDIWKSN